MSFIVALGKCTMAGYPCPRRVTSLLQGDALIPAQLSLLGFAAILNELNPPLNTSGVVFFFLLHCLSSPNSYF